MLLRHPALETFINQARYFIRMSKDRKTYSVSIGQGRIGAGILAATFAGVAIVIAWPRPGQPFTLGGWILLVINAALCAIFVRQAMKRVSVRERDVLVSNWNRTKRIPISKVRAFSSHQPGRFSRISVRPVLECDDGRSIRLDALIPILGSLSLDADVVAALRRLNHEVSTRRTSSSRRQHSSADESG
jgi:hypothetical protein